METLTVGFIDMDTIERVRVRYQGSQPVNSTPFRRQGVEE